MKFNVLLSNLEVFIATGNRYGVIPKKRSHIQKINAYLKTYEDIPPGSEPVFFCKREEIGQVLRLAKVSESFIKESEILF